MLVSINDGRKFIADNYPGLKYRLSTKTTIGNRPVFESMVGLPTLAWKRVDLLPESMVAIGLVQPNHVINWGYEPCQPDTNTPCTNATLA